LNVCGPVAYHIIAVCAKVGTRVSQQPAAHFSRFEMYSSIVIAQWSLHANLRIAIKVFLFQLLSIEAFALRMTAAVPNFCTRRNSYLKMVLTSNYLPQR